MHSYIDATAIVFFFYFFFYVLDQPILISEWSTKNKSMTLTINPASTVGTSVNLLPSEMPRSWSLPELSRLKGETERDN